MFFLLLAQLLHLFFALNLNVEEQTDGFFLDTLDHVLEDLVGFTLIGHQRVLLTVAAKPDPLLQVIHIEEMVFPVAVHRLQQDIVLQILHHGRPEFPLTRFVPVADRLEQLIQHIFLGLIPQGLDGKAQLESEQAREFDVQLFEIPIFGKGFLAGAFQYQMS